MAAATNGGMTDVPAHERRFDDEEFALILRRAAELQERPQGRGRGYTLAEIEQIAREAGIAPTHIRTAAATLARGGGRTGVLTALAGGAYRFRYEHRLPTELSDADRGAIVDAARVELEAQGEARAVLDTIEWTKKDDLGSVFVTVTRRDGETLLRAGADRKAAAGLLVGLVPFGGAIAGTIATAALGLGPGIQAAALIGGGTAGSYLLARLAWTRISATWEKRLSRLMARLTATSEERIDREQSNVAGAPRL